MTAPSQPLTRRKRSRWEEFLRFWHRFKRNKGAVLGLSIFLLIILMSLFAEFIAPYDPLEQNYLESLQPSTLKHWLGTDSFGRDLLSRIIFGARIALIVGILSVFLAMIIGVFLGLISGYYGGLVDTVIMRIMDGLYAFPVLILAIGLMAILGLGVRNVIIAVAVGYIAPFARVTRGDVLAVREETYIEAARLGGMSHLRIIFRHVLPNVMAPIVVQGALRVSAAIIAEAGLSFLGLGPPPPMPTWGSMISEGRNFIVLAWWISTFPGITLMITVMGLNLFGDGLRDTLDPKLKGR
ncbi:MAG: ABC transporter permease [Candidatus Tectomicrobia bacterium]|nr:ABC transporter permease [Candidatus Tectomicrobia bacterium]